MKAAGPAARRKKLTLLEPFRDKLPAEVFGEPYSPPVTDGSAATTATTCEARDCQRSWLQARRRLLRNDKGERAQRSSS